MFACEICNKGVVIGKDGTYRHGGGWARRAPKVKKIWKPNLRTIRIVVAGQTRRLKLCAKCLKKIKLVKKQPDFAKATTGKETKKTTPETAVIAPAAA